MVGRERRSREWMQLDLGSVQPIAGARLKGYYDYRQWMKTVRFEVSDDETTWTDVEGGRVFDAFTDAVVGSPTARLRTTRRGGSTRIATRSTCSSPQPCLARYMRIYAVTWESDYGDQSVGGVIAGKAAVLIPDPDTDKPTITISGDENITISMNEAYSEPGFTATDTRDGVITHRVVVGGSVDSTQVGVYTLTYDVSDAADNAADQVIRTVTVEAGLSAAEYFTVDRSGYYRSHLTSSVSRTTTNLQKHDGSRYLVSRQDQVYTNSANNETLTFNAMEFHNSSLNMGAIGNYSGPYTVSIFFRRRSVRHMGHLRPDGNHVLDHVRQQ